MGYSPGSTILSSVTVDISWKTVTFDVKCELLLKTSIMFFFSSATRPLVHKYRAWKPT